MECTNSIHLRAAITSRLIKERGFQAVRMWPSGYFGLALGALPLGQLSREDDRLKGREIGAFSRNVIRNRKPRHLYPEASLRALRLFSPTRVQGTARTEVEPTLSTIKRK